MKAIRVVAMIVAVVAALGAEHCQARLDDVDHRPPSLVVDRARNGLIGLGVSALACAGLTLGRGRACG